MGKDRLQELRLLNPESTTEPDLTGLDMGDQDNEVQTFLSETDRIQGLINQIRSDTEKISEKHGQKLAAVSETQGNKNNQEIDDLNSDLTSCANKVRASLKKMDKELKSDTANKQSATYRMQCQQSAKISRDFFNAMTDYNDVQKRVQRQYRIVKPDVTDEEIDAALDSEAGDSIFAQQILSPGHQEAKKALEEIKDRHEEIIKLEKSLRELNQLFQEIALLVEQQGEMLDHIEFNVGEAVDYTAEAKVELKAASSYNRAANKKKILFFILLLIIIAVVAV
eukprot:Awhi_evm1s8743